MLFPGCESSIEVGGIMKLSWGVETRYIRVRQSSNLTLVRLARRQLVRFLYKVSEMYTNTVVQQWNFSFFFLLPSSGTHWSYVFCRGRVDNESDALLIYYAAGTTTHHGAARSLATIAVTFMASLSFHARHPGVPISWLYLYLALNFSKFHKIWKQMIWEIRSTFLLYVNMPNFFWHTTFENP